MADLTQVSAEATARAVRRGCAVVRGSWRGTVTHMSGKGWTVIYDEAPRFDGSDDEPPGESSGSGGTPADGGWRIDPTDRVGRACLAWVLQDDSASITSSSGHLWTIDARYKPAAVAFTVGVGSMWVSRATQHLSRQEVVHYLAHLAPADDTRLPDGSRWVDAEALVLVVNHVLRGAHDAA